MTKSYFSLVAVSAASALGFFGVAAAQPLMSGLIECREIGDDSDRLACFDQLARGVDLNQVAEAAAVTDAEDAVVEPVLTAEERFGAEDLPETIEKKRKEQEKIKSLTASAIDIARNGRGKYVIILDNGQVWRQLSADTGKLRVPRSGGEGIGVEIKRRSLGAHVLYINGEKRPIRVERIK